MKIQISSDISNKASIIESYKCYMQKVNISCSQPCQTPARGQLRSKGSPEILPLMLFQNQSCAQIEQIHIHTNNALLLTYARPIHPSKI